MTLRISQILDFQNLYEQIKNISMPLKIAYKFSKLASKMEVEIAFYQQKIQDILSKYGKKDEMGQFVLTEDKKGVQIQEEDIEVCQKEIAELQNLTVTIDGISFSLDELETLNLTIETMKSLLPFIEE